MQLHAQEFKLDEKRHEELCKREHSAMIIKRAKPDPVDFISTVQQWITETLEEYETYGNTFLFLQNETPQEIKKRMPDPENWHEALTDETLI